MRSKYLLIGAVLVVLAFALAGCATATPAPVEATPCPAAPPCPECPAPPAPEPCPEPVVKEVPFQDMWVASPHNDVEAEAFNHWNEDDPKEVPTSCATCHSTPGYQDFLGADGSPAGVVDKAAAIGTTIQCVACHNSATASLSAVTFPSGAVIEGLGSEARCMVCHQGRASMVQVDASLEKNGLLEDLDKVSADQSFVNIHYFAAAATLYGTRTKGGYEYEGKAYDYKNDHVDGYDTCVGCHNPHTLQLKVEECAVCHEGVASVEDIKKIRMPASAVDYDGDGDVTEGIAAEIEGLQAMLLTAIQSYGKDVAGVAVGYSQTAYPYFFADPNADGALDEAEAISDNAYKAWTGRLLRAAYNYQTSIKDPGAFAHGGKYIVELLYDSIEDLNTVLATPVDLSTANRIDAGHFAGSQMAFRDWDDTGSVPYNCSKCHSATGLPEFIHNGGTVAVQANGSIFQTGIGNQPASNGFKCTTCHDEANWPAIYPVAGAVFPSGKTLTFSTEKTDSGAFVPVNSNICLMCHQGRTSKLSIDNNAAVKASLTDDKSGNTVSDKISFQNIHYFAAGATFFGADAQGAYLYADKEYAGPSVHPAPGNTCIGCHDMHALNVKEETCATCHAGQTIDQIRMSTTDFDGDGDVTEGIKGEIETLRDALLAEIMTYAEAKGTPIVYDSHSHPYFFVDADKNGEADVTDAGSKVRYAAFTPNLLKAAYNFQLASKDPGTFAHNPAFIMQVMFDSIEALGGDTGAFTRP